MTLILMIAEMSLSLDYTIQNRTFFLLHASWYCNHFLSAYSIFFFHSAYYYMTYNILNIFACSLSVSCARMYDSRDFCFSWSLTAVSPALRIVPGTRWIHYVFVE